MNVEFDVDKIAGYLEKFKPDLPKLYKWDVKIEKLSKLKIVTEERVNEINRLTPYNKELQLKKIVGQKLNETFKTDKSLFNALCLWIIKDWGGISAGNDEKIKDLIKIFLKQEKFGFDRIASSSKVASFMFPDEYTIYDSRVAHSLNWIILSENAGQRYFPIPEGRNSKMSAFDLNVLIRLKNMSIYQPADITQIDNRLFIKNSDSQLFIDKKDAYCELNKLVKQINRNLWSGDSEKELNLYYTEMLLFSIADREIFMDITKRWNELPKDFEV